MTCRSILGVLAVAVLQLCTYGQNLPDEYHMSDDSRRLVAGGSVTSGFYSEDEIKVIHLTFAQSNFWTLLQNSHTTGVPVLATMEYNGNTYDSVGVKLKGMTSYQQIPNGSQKYSFDINMDTYIPTQDVAGYESFNLNNEFQDNSVMRDVFYKHMIRPHVPAGRACFAQLYINGSNWGHYNMVEDLDSDFIREWWWSNDGTRWRADRPSGVGGGGGGQWGDGTAALNFLGTDTTLYQQYYTLGRSEQQHPWDALVLTCDKLNNTPIAQLGDTMDKYMDIDRVLWHLACENAFGDDDSYIYKGKMDYSLYWDPETQRMTTQEIDGNSVLENQALAWSPVYHADNINYPLLNRVLQVGELRQRYLAHLRHIINTSMVPADVTALIATYRGLIDTVVQADPIKLMTYAQYTSGCTMLGNNCTTRRNNLLANSEVAQVAPVIASVDHSVSAGLNAAPVAGETVHVTTSVTSGSGLSGVRLHWSNVLPGRFQRTAMFDDGAHGDGAANDGVFGADIPGQAAGTWVRYYVEAKAGNAALSASYSPAGAEHDVYIYQVTTTVSPEENIVINEVMASNAATSADENGDFDDWIELYNKGNNAVDIGGWFMSDTPFEPTKWQVPTSTILDPNTYLIIWTDENGAQGALHANFKLSASGESVLLYDADTLLVDQVDFADQVTDMGYARVPNGNGPFVIQEPTFSANNNNVGLAEVQYSSTFRMYPNPAREQVVLVWNDGTPRALTIQDATGRTVWSNTVRSGCAIDLGDLSSGTYTVRSSEGWQRLAVVH